MRLTTGYIAAKPSSQASLTGLRHPALGAKCPAGVGVGRQVRWKAARRETGAPSVERFVRWGRLAVLVLGLLAGTKAEAQSTRALRLEPSAAVAGQTMSCSVVFHAQGDENALGFSVTFDPTRFAFMSATPTGAAGRLLLNTNLAASGRLGFAFSQSAGRTYSAGTLTLVRIGFQTGPTTGPTTLGFGDTPVVAETVGIDAQVLTTTREGVTVDVAPLLGPSIDTHPASQTVHAGTNVVLTVVASGSEPLRYQWERNGVAVSGGLQPELRLENVKTDQAGDYRVVVSNAAGSATSDVARLIVLPPLTPPSFVRSPQSAVASVGESVTFQAEAGGSEPILYQWQREQADLPGQTNALLTLTNLAVAQGGNYRLVARNPVGQATSEPATLAVSANPRTVRVGTTDTPTGNLIDLPVQLYALGDENSVGFSLEFDPTRLEYRGVRCGPAGQGTALNLNTNSLAQGRLGVALGKPMGQTFAAGTAPILYVQFLCGHSAGSNPVIVTDTPVAREIADVTGRPRFSAFLAGAVNILDTPPAIVRAPSDTAARIFSTVHLEAAANGSWPLSYQWLLNGEPLSGATNPTLVLNSVMPSQAGEYRIQVSNALASAVSPPARLEVRRVVRLTGTNVPTGTTVAMPLELLTAGTENALGFSLRFDPTLLALRSAVLNAGITNLTLNLRTNAAYPGLLGVAMARSPGASFSAGTQSVMTLTFEATQSPGPGRLAFSDTPVRRELADTNADVVATEFVDGEINTARLAPQISRHPVPREVMQWESAVFAVVASGSLPLSYQWQLNGADLPGATNTTFSIVSAQPANAGNYSVRLSNIAGTLSSSNALLTVNLLDTNGPVIASPMFQYGPLVQDQSIAGSGQLSVDATDPSGVSRVEFYVDDAQVGADVDGKDGFSAFLNLELYPDGPHAIGFRAYDFRSNPTRLDVPVQFALARPDPPTIGYPAPGLVTGNPTAVVRGSAPVRTSVVLYRNGVRIGVPAPVSVQGIFENTLVLVEGTNIVEAAAVNRAGESARSTNSTTIVLDTTTPAGPAGLRATARSGGRVLLEWAPSSQSVKGYHVYRASAGFTNRTEATRLTATPVTSGTYEDRPPDDGRWYYRVTTINLAGVEGYLSDQASVDSDKTPPVATSIVYQTSGSYDAASRRFGKGIVSLTLDLSEAVDGAPFLSVTPRQGMPILIDLTRITPTQYRGNFPVGDSTPSGTAVVAFSARDRAGNRGNRIDTGSSIQIDTAAPEVTALTVQPSDPIRNAADTPVLVTLGLTLSEPLKTNSLPQIAYILSQSAPTPQPVATLTPGADLLHWTVTFRLPAAAGQTTETLAIQYQGEDDLGNRGSRIIPSHQFQVYQGDLPQLSAPDSMNAKGGPRGAIALEWTRVAEAADYELHRRPLGQTEFALISRTGDTNRWSDTPPADGIYEYGVAAVRSENGQETVSQLKQSNAAESDRVPPHPPENLILLLANNGIAPQWSPPTVGAEQVDHYSLYRQAKAITDLTGLTPLYERFPPNSVDAAPRPDEPYYAVASVDRFGNVSPPSKTAYLNIQLYPVQSLTVAQTNSDPPILTWTQVGDTVAGHDVFLGDANSNLRLNRHGLVTNNLLIDVGYTEGERRYTIFTVDRNLQRSPGRSILLPALSATPDSQAVVKRGLMNRLVYTVRNDSAEPLNDARLVVTLGGRVHSTEPFWLPALSVTNIPVVVGGYAELPDGTAPIEVLIESHPEDGATVRWARSGTVPVGDGQLLIGVLAADLVRGGVAKARFSVLNPSTEVLEIVTAASQGSAPSPDVRLTLFNAEGNLLATAPFHLGTGTNVVLLPDGNTVMRLEPGQEVVSPEIDLPIPATVPNHIWVRVEIDRVFYHSDRDDRVEMPGVQTAAPFVVVSTSYTGAVTAVTPEHSRGGEPIVISGRAWFRLNREPAPFQPLLLKIANSGFERTEQVVTDTNGLFRTEFTPLAGESGGIYSVWAVHPDLTDRTVQKQFVVDRILASPTDFVVRIPHYYIQAVPVSVTSGPGTVATNLHFAFLAEDQPLDRLPEGVTVDTGGSIAQMGPNAVQTLNFSITGTPDARRNVDLVLRLVSGDSTQDPWAKVKATCEFSEATPSIHRSPAYLITGVAPGTNIAEQVTFENFGLAAATNVFFSLHNEDGTPAPEWVALASQPRLQQLAQGETTRVGVTFQPRPTHAEGQYSFRLKTRAANTTVPDVLLDVKVITSDRGNLEFKVVDMDTQTTANGAFANGVQNARIRITKPIELMGPDQRFVAGFETNAVTDAEGIVTFTGLPVGSYDYHVVAENHHSRNGRVSVRAGTTASQQVALTYSLVSVEWEVVPITIEDRYEIVLTAVFETDVPAAQVTIEPTMVNLPQLFAGDVFHGEFVLRNSGLIAADHFRFTMPAATEYLTYELLSAVPDRLLARQNIRLPYRLVCTRSMPGPNKAPSNPGGATLLRGGRLADSGDCDGLNYSDSASAAYDYMCANGLSFDGSASSGFGYGYNPGCGGPNGRTNEISYKPPKDSDSSPSPESIENKSECPPPDECHPTDECDTSCCNRGGQSKSWVDLPSRDYRDEILDLQVPVRGGTAVVKRQYYRNGWHWYERECALRFAEHASNSPPGSITRNLVSYILSASPTSVYEYRQNRIIALPDGYRWENKGGDWEFFGLSGQRLASGRRGVQVLGYVYDSEGRLIAQTDAGGTPVLRYDYAEPNGWRLMRVWDSTGREVRYGYNAEGLLESVTDPLKQTTTYRYDRPDPRLGAIHPWQLVEKRYPDGTFTTITYHASGIPRAPRSVLDQDGNGYYYNFWVTVNTGERGASVRSSSGHIVTTTFDNRGRLATRDANGVRAQAVVRSDRTDATTDAAGQTTVREYDDFGNVVKETRPDGGVKQWEYDPLIHKPTRAVEPLGAVTLMAYDVNGNLTNKVEAAGTPSARTNQWVYNEWSELTRRIDARGNRMDYTYDDLGRLVREFDPDNPAYQTLYAYDDRGNRTGVTNALGFVTRYGYDELDRLVAETNALGHLTLNTYDGKNLVEVETGREGRNRGRITRYRYDADGRRTHTIRVDEAGTEHVWETTTYDSDGRVIAVANALGQTTRYEYNEQGQQVKAARPFSETQTSDTRYEYDDAGRRRREIDPLGVVTEYEYDSMGRESKVTEAVGTDVQRSRARTYDFNGNLTSITYSDGTNALTTFYDYDLLNRRIGIRGAREYPKQFEYDGNGNQTAEINGRGYRTEYAYDAYNRNTNTVEGIGHGESGEHAGSFVYDLVGNIVTAYDGNWNHRHYRQDGLGQQIAESIPLAPTNALPASEWWTDNGVVLNRTWYNPWGQRLATSNIVGAVTTTVYDTFGLQFTYTDAAGLTLTNSYNALDQLLAIGYPLVSTAPKGSPPTAIRYEYDPNNSQMLVSITDRAGLATRYAYDRRFQRASELSSWGALTTFRTDALRRQTAVTNALNEVTGSVFDQFDQLVATIYADHIPVTQERIEYRAYDEFGKMTNHWGAATYDVWYEYDLTGNQTKLVDGNGNPTRWEYDGRNRKIRKIYADNTDYEYAYDANGNQTRQRDAMQRTARFEFNAYNLSVHTDYPNDPDVTFGYDRAGRRLWMVDGTGTNHWTYDLADRIVSNAQLNVEHAVSYTFDLEGNRLSMTVTPLAGGEVWHTDYTYDKAGRLENITDRGLSEAPFHYTWATNAARLKALTHPLGLKTTHDYDLLGRKTRLSTCESDGVQIALFAYAYSKAGQRTNEATLTHTDRFDYDAKRQLISAQRYDLGCNPDPTWSYRYAYDLIGNWTTTSDAIGTHCYLANTLNQYTSVSNTTVSPLRYDKNGCLLAHNGNVYGYDDAERCVSVISPDSRVSLAVDGLDRRVSVLDGATLPFRQLVYDNWLIVGAYDYSANKKLRITRGLDISLRQDGAGGLGGVLATTEDTRQWVLADGKGNVRLKGGWLGGSAESIEYSPFGALERLTLESPHLGFCGMMVVNQPPLVLFPGRCHLPLLGRWTSRDPADEAGGVHLYAYCANDPVNRVDAWGFCGRLTESWTHVPGGNGGSTTGGGSMSVTGIPCPIQACPRTSVAQAWVDVRERGGHLTVSFGDTGCSAGSVFAHEAHHADLMQNSWLDFCNSVTPLATDCVDIDEANIRLRIAKLYGRRYSARSRAENYGYDCSSYRPRFCLSSWLNVCWNAYSAERELASIDRLIAEELRRWGELSQMCR